jgi:hypothetical protein
VEDVDVMGDRKIGILIFSGPFVFAMDSIVIEKYDNLNIIVRTHQKYFDYYFK